MHVYEVRPRKDHRGVDLISAALPFGRLWYGEPNAVSNAVDYAKFRSRAHDAVIRVYDEAGKIRPLQAKKNRGSQRLELCSRSEQRDIPLAVAASRLFTQPDMPKSAGYRMQLAAKPSH
jgi:hypothetical protein